MSTSSTHVPRLSTALSGPLLDLEKSLIEQQDKIELWFEQQWSAAPPAFYSSVDLRNAGFKLAPVDTNLFPAGFNNLNPDFTPLCVEAARATIAEICPDVTRLLVIPESHSRNLFYFESLNRLFNILKKAGYETRLGSLDPTLTEPKLHTLPSGETLLLEPLVRNGDTVGVADYTPCCIVLNNDLSDGVPSILAELTQTIVPAPALGWASRLKSEHFRFYQHVAEDFAATFNLDPWLLSPLFDRCPEVDFMKREGQSCLVKRSEGLLKAIRKKYEEYGIQKDPFLAIKADAGTYGMAVMMIRDPQELYELNRKQRTRMSSAKGGGHVTKAILQEGVHTFETMPDDGAAAEPVVYLIGRKVVGGFYRVHKKRGDTENLNAPGMDFRPLAFAENCQASCDETQPANRFYAYGVVARLASLAAARELMAIKQPRAAISA